MKDWLIQFGVTFAIFIIVDLLWLGILAKPIYDKYLGDLLASPPNWSAAILFYALFIVGLIYFAITPALDGGSIADAAKNGALFGFFTYMTYELTNYAVIKDWPWQIVPIDIAWGAVLGLSVSAASCYTISKIL